MMRGICRDRRGFILGFCYAGIDESADMTVTDCSFVKSKNMSNSMTMR